MRKGTTRDNQIAVEALKGRDMIFFFINFVFFRYYMKIVFSLHFDMKKERLFVRTYTDNTGSTLKP